MFNLQLMIIVCLHSCTDDLVSLRISHCAVINIFTTYYYVPVSMLAALAQDSSGEDCKLSLVLTLTSTRSDARKNTRRNENFVVE